MLPLLVLGLAAAQASQGAAPPHRTFTEVDALLRSLGEDFGSSGPDATASAIVRGDAYVDVGMPILTGPHGDLKSGRVTAIDLSTEMAFSQEVHTPDLSSRGSMVGVTTPTVVASHLGRTATVQKHIELTESFSRDRLREDLAEFWRTVDAFAREHGGRFVSGRAARQAQGRLSSRLVLDKADEVSLGRATDAWGWTWRKGFGGSFSGWAFPIDLEGRLVVVYENNNGALPHHTSFLLIGTVAVPKSLDLEAWSAIHADLKRDLSLSRRNEDSASVDREIDLSHGPTLGNLHAQFLAFSRDLAALERRFASNPKDGSVLPR